MLLQISQQVSSVEPNDWQVFSAASKLLPSTTSVENSTLKASLNRAVNVRRPPLTSGHKAETSSFLKKREKKYFNVLSYFFRLKHLFSMANVVNEKQLY